MTRFAVWIGMAAVLAAGCSKDEGDSAGADKRAAPGVSVVPANELGPQADEIVDEVSITTTSKQARAAFVRGRELYENVRHAEAGDKFREAIELDEKFALAHTFLGLTMSGPDGVKMLRRGFELAELLPPAERMVTKVFLLKRDGDREAYSKAVRKMAELAPGDWRVQMWFAHDLQDNGDIDGALAAFQKSTRLNDKAAEPYNYIGYIHANRGEYDKAVEAAKRYAELKASEPNPQDSLGEILMMAGKLEQAEQAFARALEVEPKFSIAWEGVAMTRVYREDYDGALEALQRARDGALNAEGRNKAVMQTAWVELARGDLDAALAAVDDFEVEERYAYKPNAARAELYTAVGDYEAAMKQLKPVIAQLEKQGDTEGLAWALVKKTVLQARAGKAKPAAKTLASVEKLDGEIGNKFFRFGLEYARGAVAAAQGDHEAAHAHFEKIDNPLYPYGVEAMWARAECLAQLPDKAEKAEALREELRTTYRRQAYHAYRMNAAK